MIVLNQNESGLKKGDIVTDTSEKSCFCGKQGKVIRVYKNGTTIVRFPLSMIPLGLYLPWEEKKPTNITYSSSKRRDLRKDDNWDEKAIILYEVKRLFLHMAHTVCFRNKPFQENTECDIKKCGKKAVGRSLINYFGTVYTFDLCRKHQKEWHGRCTEELPEKK